MGEGCCTPAATLHCATRGTPMLGASARRPSVCRRKCHGAATPRNAQTHTCVAVLLPGVVLAVHALPLRSLLAPLLGSPRRRGGLCLQRHDLLRGRHRGRALGLGPSDPAPRRVEGGQQLGVGRSAQVRHLPGGGDPPRPLARHRTWEREQEGGSVRGVRGR